MLNIQEKSWSFGSQWAKAALQELRSDIMNWIIFGLFNIGILLFLSCIPFVGSIGTSIAPLIISGVAMRLIHEKHHNQMPMSFPTVQTELKTNGMELFGLGALSWGLGIVALGPILISIFGLFSMKFFWFVQELLENPSSIDDLPFITDSDITGLVLSLFLGFVGTLVLLVGVFMATVFAPYLITIKKQKTFDAIRLSFKAVHNNPWSITSLSLWWLIYAVAGLLLCCVGIFVMTPLIQLSTYYAAEDIFREEE